MSEDIGSTGPVYNIYLERDTTLLGGLTSVEFLGIPCLCGVALQVGKRTDWIAGSKVYIPVDKVTRIIEYASVESYRKMLAEFYARKAGE